MHTEPRLLSPEPLRSNEELMSESITTSRRNRTKTNDETTDEEGEDAPRIVLGADQRDVWRRPHGGKVLGVN